MSELNKEKALAAQAAWDSLGDFVETIKKELPITPTDEMREEGAKRLVSVETDADWPDKFTPLQRAAARNEAERVWRSMWLAAISTKVNNDYLDQITEYIFQIRAASYDFGCSKKREDFETLIKIQQSLLTMIGNLYYEN